MKIQQIMQVSRWYNSQTLEVQKKADKMSGLELKVYSDCKLSQREKKIIISDFLAKTDYDRRVIATKVANFARMNPVKEETLTDLTYRFIKTLIEL